MPTGANWPAAAGATEAALAALTDAGIRFEVISDTDTDTLDGHTTRAVDAFGGVAGVWDVARLLAEAGVVDLGGRPYQSAQVEASLARVATRTTARNRVRYWWVAP